MQAVLILAVALLPQDTLVLKTGSPTGTYTVLGEAIQRVIHETNPGLLILTEHSTGSVENIRSVIRWESDLAIVQNDVAYFATRGLEGFEGVPAGDLRAIVSLHPEDVLVITRASLGLTSITDINSSHRMVIGEAGSGTISNAKNVLRALGIRFEDVDTLMRPSRSALPLLAADSADVIFLTAGVSSTFVEEIRDSGGSIISIPTSILQELEEQHPYYTHTTIALGADTITTVRIRALLITHRDVPSSTVRNITEAIHARLGVIRASHPRASEIVPHSLDESIPIAIHPGARAALCDAGIAQCGRAFTVVVGIVVLFGLLYAGLLVSESLRRVFIRVAPRWSERWCGPHSMTDTYRYAFIPIMVVTALMAGAFTVRHVEAEYARDHNVDSDFNDIGINENLLWMIVFTASGYEDGRFPKSPIAKLVSALMSVVGIGGGLLSVGLITGERVARRLKSENAIVTENLHDHVIVCGWNRRAIGVVRSLTNPELHGRRQTVVVVSDVSESPLAGRDFSRAHTAFVKGDPAKVKVLEQAGLVGADAVVILADENVREEDRDAKSLMILTQVEKQSHEWTSGAVRRRSHGIHTIVELVDPGNRSVMERAHANQIICEREFEQKLLAQSVLNPGLGRFMHEILTVDDGNEIIEVPVTGNERTKVVDLTFRQMLVNGLSDGLLLLAIHQCGAPGTDGAEPGTPARVITNPTGEKDRTYRIAKGDSLLFLALSERDLEKIFPNSDRWKDLLLGEPAGRSPASGPGIHMGREGK